MLVTTLNEIANANNHSASEVQDIAVGTMKLKDESGRMMEGINNVKEEMIELVNHSDKFTS